MDGGYLAVDARETFKNVPVGINGLVGNYTFKIANNNFPTGTFISLEDKYLNTQTELIAGATYNFSITTDATTKGENRFVLNFTQKALATIIDNAAAGFTAKVLGNIVQGNTVMVKISGADKPVTVRVIDISGKTIKTVTATNGTNAIDISQAAGIKLVQISNGQTTITEKVVRQ